MTRILHTSDLHFSGKDPNELEYSIQVWRNILEIGIKQNAEAILLSGDIFDTFNDLEKYRRQFLQEASGFDIPIYAIAGNHEYLRMSSAESLQSFGLNSIHWYYQDSFAMVTPPKANWELAVIPYSQKYESYRNWDIPIKKNFRILMAHGIIPEAVSYTGPSEEEGDHLLELNMLEPFQADYIALGHIHKKTQLHLGNCRIYYPGSPRVWRKGERGVRSVNIIEITDSQQFSVKEIPVEKAGEYYEIDIQVLPGGNLDLGILKDSIFTEWDYLHINVKGFADSENLVEENIKKLIEEYEPKLRKFEIDNSEVQYLDGISENILVGKFLSLWGEKYNSLKSEEDRNILLEARQIGLKAISDRIKGKR